MSRLVNASIIAGALPVVIVVAGLVATGALLAHRRRSWWTRVVPAAAVGATVGALLIGAVVNWWWQPFPDPLPTRILAWIGFALFGLGVAGATCGSRTRVSRWRRLAAVPLLGVLLTLPAMKVNAFYGYYPTLRTVLGIPDVNQIDLTTTPRTVPNVATAPGQSVDQTWQPPPDMPISGRVARVEIPAPESKFRARAGSVYLPPAYLSAQRRALLPVLVLIAGQPGSPQDWLTAGRLAEVMDGYAAAHRGLAPIVVLPDATGATLANPLCLDSRLGNADTYLARDVPDWINHTLQVDPDPHHWAIAGFSYGGTCALQLAVRHPDTYPTFLDISGQAEPTLGNHSKTVAATFGGDEAAFRAVNPLDILATTAFPTTAGILAVGAQDHDYGPQAQQVLTATRHAGMTIQLVQIPGGHSWTVAITALDTALPWLAARAQLIGPTITRTQPAPPKNGTTPKHGSGRPQR